MAGVLDYSTTAGDNVAINGIGILGSSPVTNFDSALRQVMADIAAGIVAGSFSGNGYVAKSGAYTVLAADRGKIIDCSTALTLTLTAAATLGAGFVVIVKANGGAVTVDPNATETINGASTSLTVADGSFAIIACTGTAWHSLVSGNVTLTGTQTLTNKTLTSPVITGGSWTGGTDLAIADGGTGASTAAAAFAALKQAATTSATGVVELATEAEATAGTDTTRAVTAAGVASAAYVAKCWAYVTVSAGVPTLAASHNITSITDTGTGTLTVTIATDFSSANWASMATVQNEDGAGRFTGGKTKTAGSIILEARGSGGALNDPDSWNLVGFGAQ